MKTERVKQLDFVRSISCIMILFTHFNAVIAGYDGGSFLYPQNTPVPIYYGDIYLGNLGVSLFFILTGSSLYCSYKKNKPHLLQFYKKRFFAIYPMYWVAYFCFFSFYLLRNKALPRGTVTHFLINVFGFGGYCWSLSLCAGEYYYIGEWFLGCLLCIYLIFPLILNVYKRLKYMSFPLSVIVLLLLPSRNINILFINRIPEILFGIIYIDYLSKVKSRYSIVAILFALLLFSARSMLDPFLYAVTVSMCLFFVFGIIGRVITASKSLYLLIRWFSSLSYPVFLIHHQIIRLVLDSFDLRAISAPLAWSLVFVCFFLIVLLSIVLRSVTTKTVSFFDNIFSET